MTLREKTVDALKWSYLATGTNMVTQLLFAAVLARLLSKEQFGLYAIGLSFYLLGQFVSDFGVGQALVQKRDLTNEDIRAGFTSSLIMGLSTSALVWFLAPLAANLLAHDNANLLSANDLVPLIRSFALLYVLTSMTVVSTSLLRREMRFKPLMLTEICSYIVGQGIVGLGAAYLGYGAYSLIFSTGVQYLIQLVSSYYFGRHPFGLTFRKESFQALYSFGGRASLINFLEYLGNTLDTWLIGRFYGAAVLGVYNRGFQTVYAPFNNLARSMIRVLAPSFSSVQEDLFKLRYAYLSGMKAMSIVLFCVAAGVFVSANEIVLVLLGDKFASAIPLVQILAIFIPFPVLSNLSGVLAEAAARLNAKIAIQSIYLVVLAICFYSVYWLGWGYYAFAGVLVVAGALRSAAYAGLASRILGGVGREIAKAYGVGVLCALPLGGVLFAAVYLLRQTSLNHFALFGIELVLGGLLLLSVILFGPANEVQARVRPVARKLLSRAGIELSSLKSGGQA
ncbi:lipopolysaccharide biosynthesis protein [Deinococcus sp.]|uniref:lipopolysaccharide biosynthesis protein n=1 Tax=Deinococcus sp. TaxID=47478 RepID=UPI003B5AB3AC